MLNLRPVGGGVTAVCCPTTNTCLWLAVVSLGGGEALLFVMLTSGNGENPADAVKNKGVSAAAPPLKQKRS